MVYASTRSGKFNIYEKDFSGTGEDVILHQTGSRIFPHHWSAADELITPKRTRAAPRGIFGSYASTERSRSPSFVPTRMRLKDASLQMDVGSLSPQTNPVDGRFYVRSVGAKGIRRLVSSGGGTNPLWRGDSRELFYFEPDDG